MRLSLSVCLALCAALGSALPGEPAKRNTPCKKRDTCNHDNCYRAVAASSAKPGSASASSDCVSFFRKTVTPCASTSTATASVTVTGAPVVVTATQYQTITSVVTALDVETVVVTTILDTDSIYAPTLVLLTSTVTQTVTVPGGFFKRAFTTSTPAGTCAATTNSPTLVPTYASACSGTARYSSACSCIGATQSTTTLPASTTTVTTTSTATLTPTVTSVATSTVTAVATEVDTSVVPTVFETTVTTVVVPLPSTIVTTVTATQTVMPPACQNFKIVVSSGPIAGQFLQANGDNTYIQFGASPLTATTFYVDAGIVRQSGTGAIWNLGDNNINAAYAPIIENELFGNRPIVQCSADRATGAFTCDAGQDRNKLYYCGSNYPYIGSSSPGCQLITLTVIPQCY